MKKKIILSVLLIFITAILAVWFFIFYKPTHFKRDASAEKAITITAKEIVKAFQTNEANANTLFLNKAVEISGEVSEIKKDQTGKSTVMLKSDDAFSNVFVTLKEEDKQPQVGNNIIVKGICTGFLSDVVIIDAIIVSSFGQH